MIVSDTSWERPGRPQERPKDDSVAIGASSLPGDAPPPRPPFRAGSGLFTGLSLSVPLMLVCVENACVSRPADVSSGGSGTFRARSERERAGKPCRRRTAEDAVDAPVTVAGGGSVCETAGLERGDPRGLEESRGPEREDRSDARSFWMLQTVEERLSRSAGRAEGSQPGASSSSRMLPVSDLPRERAGDLAGERVGERVAERVGERAGEPLREGRPPEEASERAAKAAPRSVRGGRRTGRLPVPLSLCTAPQISIRDGKTNSILHHISIREGHCVCDLRQCALVSICINSIRQNTGGAVWVTSA